MAFAASAESHSVVAVVFRAPAAGDSSNSVSFCTFSRTHHKFSNFPPTVRRGRSARAVLNYLVRSTSFRSIDKRVSPHVETRLKPPLQNTEAALITFSHQVVARWVMNG